MSNQRTQFTALMRALHWTMAAMVLTQLGIGVTMVASLADYHTLVSIHRPLGAAILVLVVVRFVVRRLSRSEERRVGKECIACVGSTRVSLPSPPRRV